MTDNVTLPARIVEYYPQTQTADIKICAERVFSNTDGKEQLSEREILQGVPVHVASGGGWSITFPIKPGNTCLVVFSQIGYDHWLYKDRDTGGTLVGQPTPHLRRSFSEDDGFALVGFNTIPRAILSYAPEDSQWRNEVADQVISLNADKSITVDTPVSVTITAPDVTINATNVVVNTTTTVVNSPLIAVTGDTTILGNTLQTGVITVIGDVIANGISLVNHKHDGDSGGETSKPKAGN